MPKLLPRDLKKAVDRLEAEPSRSWTLDDLATVSGVARRTLHKRFRRFLSCTQMEFLRDLRLDRVRQDLLEASPGANITEVAMRWGLTHLGRFAARFR